jgi:tRNA pseudouridine13 synthase
LLVPKIEELIGIGAYATKTSGINGAIRKSVDDFVVQEVLVDGSKAQIEKATERPPLGASLTKQRYLLCVLTKRDWDTFIAIKNVARQLDKSQNQIQIAGIKDGKAITSQYITIEQALIEDASNVSIKDIELRPVGYLREELSTYYLLGNSFEIKIEDIHRSESAVRSQIAETTGDLELAGGIPNFFGHQRFGTTRPITHLVGKALVKGDFGEAAMIFLAKPSDYEHPSSRQARSELASTQNFKQALKDFPKQLRYERLMLDSLAQNQEDFLGAFKRLPVRLQALFVQAYQSYLFNRFLTERIKLGVPLNEAEAGDWVVGVERSSLPLVNMARIVDADNSAEIASMLKYGRMRVALPIVGRKKGLSKGVMRQIEKQILEEEGVRIENFTINGVPSMGARGGLRAIVAPIRDFKLDELSSSVDDSEGCEAKISFFLLRGCYATVLLREIMKPNNPIGSGF